MKRIIYPTTDGGVAVIIPAPEARRQICVGEGLYRAETDDEFMERIAAKDVPDGIPYKIIDTADVPTDRTFRNAWEYQP